MADVYILLGSEEGEKNNLIKKLKSTALEAHPDAECYSFYASDDDETSFASAISQSSLFSSYRFIVLKGFDEVKKSGLIYKAVIEALKENQNDLTLIIVSSESSYKDYDSIIINAAGKDNIRVFWELTEAEKKRWIVTKVREENFNITNDAVDEILSTVENNTEDMKNTVLSITNFLRLKGEKSTIDKEDIETYATASKGENGYTLFKAAAECDLDKALRIVSSIILNDSKNLLGAVTVMANQFRRTEEALRMKENRTPESTIFSSLISFSSFAQTKARKGVNFKEADIFRCAMRNYTLEDTKRVILLLGKADTTLKSTSPENLTREAELLIYSIIVNKGKESALSLDPPLLEEDPLSRS